MRSDEIEKYLTELGAKLKQRGIKKPVRLMLIGGAYMLLLAHAPRSTNDIDVFWLEEDAFQRTLNPLRESVQAITARYALNPDWFNYVAQMLIYDEFLSLMASSGNDLGRCTSMFQRHASKVGNSLLDNASFTPSLIISDISDIINLCLRLIAVLLHLRNLLHLCDYHS